MTTSDARNGVPAQGDILIGLEEHRIGVFCGSDRYRDGLYIDARSKLLRPSNELFSDM
jgi:hypothetical protein